MLVYFHKTTDSTEETHANRSLMHIPSSTST